MHCRFTRAAILACLACGLTGCSSTSGSKSWWPSFSLKKKPEATSHIAGNNAPQAPSYSTAAAAPSVSMPGAYGAPPAYGGTQYPVTPYPTTAAPAYSAAPGYATAPGYAAAPASATSGYMPPHDPYAAAPPANPYAAAAATNPYPAPSANTYAAPQGPAYSTAGQYGAAPYPGGPSGGDTYSR